MTLRILHAAAAGLAIGHHPALAWASRLAHASVLGRRAARIEQQQRSTRSRPGVLRRPSCRPNGACIVGPHSALWRHVLRGGLVRLRVGSAALLVGLLLRILIGGRRPARRRAKNRAAAARCALGPAGTSRPLAALQRLRQVPEWRGRPKRGGCAPL